MPHPRVLHQKFMAQQQKHKGKGSVLLPWTQDISYMQQSVLIAAVRGPDGIRKDHPVKVLCRFLRRSFMLSAFEGRELPTAIESGGGSFTGPFISTNAAPLIDDARQEYLRYVDELPHHFQLHLMHAAEILGFKHPNPITRLFWIDFYYMIVNDAHLRPEREEDMDERLGDSEEAWRAREEVTAH